MKEWIDDGRGFEGRCFVAVVVFNKGNNYILRSFPGESERNDPEIEGVICLKDNPKNKKASSVQR